MLFLKFNLTEKNALNRFAILSVLLLAALPALAEPAGLPEDVLARYREALDRQQQTMKDVAMDVTMEAKIPKLKKEGTLNALRQISQIGRVTYKIIGFFGDDTVKKEVMARYMTAEVESAGNKKSSELALTPENYNFKYKGLNNKEGHEVHVFELKPRAKRVGLFKGELWIDPQTYLPVREQGRFVKSPSVFIKKVDFVRNYEIRDGVAYLTHLESTTDTRIVGVAQLDIDYCNYHEEPAAEQPVEEAKRALLNTLR